MTNIVKSIYFAYFLAIGNATILGFSFLFTKIALETADPIDTLMYRYIVAFVFISIPVLLRWTPVRYRRESFMKITLISLLYPILSFSFQAYGLVYATSSEGGILFALTPIITLVLAALFLREKTTILQKLCVCLSVLGVVYIFVMKEMAAVGFQLASYKGMVLLLLSVCSLASFSVMSRFLSKVATPMELSYMMMACGAVFFTIASFVKHGFYHSYYEMVIPLTKSGFVFSILYLGVLSSLVTSLLTNYTLSKIEASKQSVFANLATISRGCFHEPPPPTLTLRGGGFLPNREMDSHVNEGFPH